MEYKLNDYPSGAVSRTKHKPSPASYCLWLGAGFVVVRRPTMTNLGALLGYFGHGARWLPGTGDELVETYELA